MRPTKSRLRSELMRALETILPRTPDFTNLISTMAGLALSFAVAAGINYLSDDGSVRDRPLEERIDALASSLTDASRTITEIEEEIQSRQDLVLELREDAETYERLAELHRDEVEAVTQALEGELEEESGESFWRNFLMSFAFFVVGAVTSAFVTIRYGRGGKAMTT